MSTYGLLRDDGGRRQCHQNQRRICCFLDSSIITPARNDDDDTLPKPDGRGVKSVIGAVPTLQGQHLPPPTPLLNPWNSTVPKWTAMCERKQPFACGATVAGRAEPGGMDAHARAPPERSVDRMALSLPFSRGEHISARLSGDHLGTSKLSSASRVRGAPENTVRYWCLCSPRSLRGPGALLPGNYVVVKFCSLSRLPATHSSDHPSLERCGRGLQQCDRGLQQCGAV
jgi:hypothetical protein